MEHLECSKNGSQRGKVEALSALVDNIKELYYDNTSKGPREKKEQTRLKALARRRQGLGQRLMI